jgi:hypothetical protein
MFGIGCPVANILFEPAVRLDEPRWADMATKAFRPCRPMKARRASCEGLRGKRQ